MPDHDFEKRIQEKMAELRVPPSAPVWDRVEEKLNKKEKHRRSLLWVPVLLAALVGSYFFIDSKTSPDLASHENGEKSRQAGNGAKAERKIKRQIDKNVVSTQNGVIKDPKLAFDTAAGVAVVNESSGMKKTAPANIQPGVRVNRNQSSKFADQVQESVNSSEDRNRDINVTKANESSENSNKQKLHDEGVTIESAEQLQTERQVLPSPVKISRAPFSEIDVFQHTRSPLSKQGEMKQASRRKTDWQFGLSFIIGRSHINNGQLANLFQNETLMDRSAFSFANSSNSAQMPGNISAYIPPSRLKPGGAFSMGGYMQRDVSSKVRLSVGLNYKLYSSSNRIGASKDTLLPASSSRTSADMMQVYRTGNSSGYRNVFHFIELPVYVTGRLINGRFPVYWNTGVSYSRLIASNALHYDNNYRLYYKDNKLLQKNQLNVQAALTTELFTSSANPLLVGPELSYGLTSLLKDNKINPKHFLFIGLKASMPLNNSF